MTVVNHKISAKNGIVATLDDALFSSGFTTASKRSKAVANYFKLLGSYFCDEIMLQSLSIITLIKTAADCKIPTTMIDKIKNGIISTLIFNKTKQLHYFSKINRCNGHNHDER